MLRASWVFFYQKMKIGYVEQSQMTSLFWASKIMSIKKDGFWPFLFVLSYLVTVPLLLSILNVSRYTSIVNDGHGERSSGDCTKEKGILRNLGAKSKSWTWFANHKKNCEEGVFIFSSQLLVLCNCLRTKPSWCWSSRFFGK